MYRKIKSNTAALERLLLILPCRDETVLKTRTHYVPTTTTKPTHQTSCLQITMSSVGWREDRQRQAPGKACPPIINWRWDSWCQCSFLGRWQEDRWDRCQLGAKGTRNASPKNWMTRQMIIFLSRSITKAERHICCLAGQMAGRALTADMLAPCLAICGSDGVVFTWQGCLGVAGVGGLIWTPLCVCAEATAEDVHMLFPRHLTQI